MLKGLWRWLIAAAIISAGVIGAGSFAIAGGGSVGGDGDTPSLAGGAQPLEQNSESEDQLLQLDLAFTSRRTAGNTPLDVAQAGELRGQAANAAKKLRKEHIPSGPNTFNAAWRQIGPNPIVQVTRTSGSFTAMSGRIGALAIRPSNGQFILGAAQGGIWLYDAANGTWSAKTSDQTTQAIGALAVAPSNDAIVYAGTGEGALSGDSYFGDGVLKSTDGGNTWSHVSDDKYFRGVAMSRIIVDPNDPNHVLAAVLRGRGGARRTSPTETTKFGIWESKDGGIDWKRIQQVKDSLGATDLEIDPQNSQILYSSFWGDAIYKSTDGGKHWATVMAGLPLADYEAGQTRFSIAISHAAPAGTGTLYAGFDWVDASGHHASRVFKSTNGAAGWAILPAGSGADTVEDYCGGQCFYDNVIEADPTNADIVYAAGQFNYGIGSGGVFRSDDGGATWKNLGYDQHPDFHALAFDPSNTARIVIGSDGGVWTSPDRGGRPNAADPLSASDWVNLNGTVNPGTAAIIARSNLSIAQFTSIATVPQIPPTAPGTGRFWGGTQDNGTLRKTGGSGQHWFDVASGDGGQVLVDPTPESCTLGPACHVYGTFFGISPYRYADGGNFFTNQYIRKGIDLTDRSDFYVPFVLNKDNPSQLFLGTYRLYRTDNAKAGSAGDVQWKTISADLTTGCAGTAPNGARNCTISAIGVGGGEAVYTGSLDGRLWVSPDAQGSDTPTWINADKDKDLPDRPVSQIAVDRSNYRIAYAAFNGFNAATKAHPGHVFRTRDGGKKWTDVSGNLPDSPVNSIVLDPSFPNTLYAGSDVGAFVTYNGGTDWWALGTGFPLVSVWQLDLDPGHRVLAAGTPGRGAFDMIEPTIAAPALVLSKVDAGRPVGPASNLDYTITLKNIGNADATGVTITDPVPDDTSFVSAADGGTNAAGTVTWSGKTVPAGGSISVHFTVSIASALRNNVDSIVNDGMKATADGGFYTTGSPFVTKIALPYAFRFAPATQRDGGRVGTSVPYTVTLTNLGFKSDSYALSATNAWATSFFDASCTSPLTTTPAISAGDSLDVCVKVAVPGGAANGETNTGTVTATSVASSTAATAEIKTIAISGGDTLLVDNDDNAPNVQSYYASALTANGISFLTWDLKADKDLPLNYTKSFKNVVWFTGNSYPAPVTPYEATLTAFLDNGGRLFMSGQDLLDQGAGTTDFVRNYLHITWDGSEAQNDKPTAAVHGVAGNPVTDGIGAVPIDHSVLGAAFEDRITPNGTATPAFTDDTAQPDALSYGGTYKVVFLAFGLESYGTAAQKADLIGRAYSFFGP
jgi:uncharacterized repeat protein (TIGR01451 family)